MISIVILTLNDNAVAFNLDILCVGDQRKVKMLSDLRTYLSGVTVDSLTTSND